jgi:hypothetical protein
MAAYEIDSAYIALHFSRKATSSKPRRRDVAELVEHLHAAELEADGEHSRLGSEQ